METIGCRKRVWEGPVIECLLLVGPQRQYCESHAPFSGHDTRRSSIAERCYAARRKGSSMAREQLQDRLYGEYRISKGNWRGVGRSTRQTLGRTMDAYFMHQESEGYPAFHTG